MLARQQRRRHHYRHLLAGHDGDEGDAQRHFGLAEPHIAADQPVHGPALHEIGQHRIDGRKLVLGLLIGKARAELVEQAFRRRDDLAGPQFARRGGADQPLGDLAHPFLELGLARLPGPATQPVELGARLIGAIARQQFDVFHRQEQPVAAVIGEEQAIVRRALHLDGLQALEAPDAVVHMHHQVAGGDGGQFGNEIARPLGPARAADEAVAQDVLFGDDRQIGGLEAGFQPQHHRCHHVAGELFHRRKVIGRGQRGDMVIAHDGLEPLARPVAPHRHQHPLAAFAQGVDMIVQRLIDVAPGFGAFSRERAPLPAARRNHRLAPIVGHLEGAQRQHRAVLVHRLPRLGVQIEPLRRQGLVGRGPETFFFQRIVAGGEIIVDERQAGIDGLIAQMVVADDGERQIGKERFQTLMEQGQPVLHALVAPPGAHGLIQRVGKPRAPEGRRIAGAEEGNGGRRHQHLAGGIDGERR